MPYLQMAELYHIVRLDDYWLRLNAPLVSAFVEDSNVAYKLVLPTDGDYVSGCLTDFERYIEGGRLAWTWFEELLSVLPPANYIDKFIMSCTWIELSQDADEEIVRRYARAYIMMLLSTHHVGNKSGTHLHIQRLPYVARLENMGRYNWRSTALV
ncbi:hypothetical protein Ahy_A02g006718 [Arachis hypogaea]|uniref:Aminotransferase-like plant mobile domain-containing protein n=1 Tax=Arachis hypogaea TaxID=3818 RepID=A0A445EB00_ARAHY|nr:hypothetical protein Ahy_A02g006718 [Arachis hypogaea]